MTGKGPCHYQLSALAEADPAGILDYTTDTWVPNRQTGISIY